MSIDFLFYKLLSHIISLVKFFIAPVLCLAVSLSAFSQAPPLIQWQKCLGGGSDENARSIINTADGGSVIVGGTFSNNDNVTGFHGLVDYWIVKLDANGIMEWQKALGGSAFDLAVSIQQTADGKYIVAGYSGSADGDVTEFRGGQDCWVVRLDTNGNILWQKSFGGDGYETGYAIEQTIDNGFVIAGSSDSKGGDVSNNNGMTDFWIVKLDANGVLQWEKSYGGSKIEGASSIKQTTDGGYIVAGYTNSNDKQVSGNHGNNDSWVLKLNSTGNIVWQKCFGGSNDEFANSVVQAPDGGFVIAGHSNSTDGDVKGNHGAADYWIVKVDATGNIQWHKTYGGSQGDAATSIRLTSNNTYIIGGLSGSTNGDVTGNHGLADIWVIETNLVGTIIWQQCYGGSGMDYEATVIQSSDGGFILGGSTTSNDGDVSGHRGMGHDFWVVKLRPPACTPTISISASSTSICYNPSIVFTAVVTNQGTNPIFRWKKNGTTIGTNSQAFTATMLNNNDVISCELISNAACASALPVVVSNSITMKAIETAPEVTIAASADTICTGTFVTFTATNKSASPGSVYQWSIDGIDVGANSTVFTSNTLKNGAIVQCKMTVPHCTVGTTKDLSDPIKIIVNPFLQPSVTITTGSTTICKGSSTVFTANTEQAGKNPVYKWMVNGRVGVSNTSTFTTNTLKDGDVITCSVEVDSSSKCIAVNNAVSNGLTIKIIEGLLPAVTIKAPDLNVCEGTALTFNAATLNAGTAPFYRWQVNGNNVGSNSSTYTSNTLVSGDKINCVLIPINTACGNQPVTSDIVTMSLKPLPVIHLVPADTTVSAESTVKLSATVGGDVFAFSWIPPNELTNSNILTTVTKPLKQTTTFKLEVTSTAQCVASKATTISVFANVYVPNSFTPNGDGKNDVFRIPPSTGLVLDNFTIYGRWGNIIFRTKDINKGWDGTDNGNKLETGSYIYIIKGSTPAEKLFLKGTVILVR